MAAFHMNDLSFVKAPPEEIELACPICLGVMLDDPHLVSCCGHHFCGPCIKRVKDTNQPCPYCMEKGYQAVPDKGRLRIINGLQVNCTNKGCGWKGELKSLPSHINREKREGECQFEVVKCKYEKCEIIQQRQHLKIHEKEKCDQRPYDCQYCRLNGTYRYITQQHYPQCTRYPVPCPNECRSDGKFPRGDIEGHLSTVCPLQPVECEFKWAGCHYSPLRKDLPQHNIESQLNHMSLLAKTCAELKRENEEMKKDNEELKRGNKEMKVVCQDMKHSLDLVIDYYKYPPLPITISRNDKGVRYFYSKLCGHLMSVEVEFAFIRLYKSHNSQINIPFIIRVHKGKPLKSPLPLVSEIVIKYRNDEGTTTTTITKSNSWSYKDIFDEKSSLIQEFILKLCCYELDVISVN